MFGTDSIKFQKVQFHPNDKIDRLWKIATIPEANPTTPKFSTKKPTLEYIGK
jgi:hypothetical protein